MKKRRPIISGKTRACVAPPSSELLQRVAALKARTTEEQNLSSLASEFLAITESTEFIARGRQVPHPALQEALTRAASDGLKRSLRLTGIRVIADAELGLHHGSAILEGVTGMFYYFEELHVGVAVFMDGGSPNVVHTRFALAMVPDPRMPKPN